MWAPDHAASPQQAGLQLDGLHVRDRSSGDALASFNSAVVVTSIPAIVVWFVYGVMFASLFLVIPFH